MDEGMIYKNFLNALFLLHQVDIPWIPLPRNSKKEVKNGNVMISIDNFILYFNFARFPMDSTFKK